MTTHIIVNGHWRCSRICHQRKLGDLWIIARCTVRHSVRGSRTFIANIRLKSAPRSTPLRLLTPKS